MLTQVMFARLAMPRAWIIIQYLIRSLKPLLWNNKPPQRAETRVWVVFDVQNFALRVQHAQMVCKDLLMSQDNN